jgi:threonine dehydrogenase-like Zn-dependent dehydrogenase
MEGSFSLKDSTVGIIGLGLMGGSLAMSLRGKCAHLVGFDSHPPTLELALSKRIIDQAASFAPSRTERSDSEVEAGVRVDLLILATPIQAILDTTYQLPITVNHPCIVMDIGSTKRDILKAMSAMPERKTWLGKRRCKLISKCPVRNRAFGANNRKSKICRKANHICRRRKPHRNDRRRT